MDKFNQISLIFGGFFDEDKLNKELTQLNDLSLSANFWDNVKYANSIIAKKTRIEDQLNILKFSESDLKSVIDLLELLDPMSGSFEQDKKELMDELDKLLLKTNNAKVQIFLNKPEDSNSAYMEIHAGAGGTESCDWANMLLRMYTRFCEKRKWTCNILEIQQGDEAGIKSVTIQINGDYVFGWLKTEKGVHRLVRISPFNANGKRQTSFASVWVYPVVDDTINIDIQEKDLRIDTYRSSGAGGQHVNKTDSAVRITHIPTKIVVACQTERSQHQNKAIAFAMLKSKLYEYEKAKQNEKKDADNSNKTENGWGNQIRSYVLQPYKMVKDLRTNIVSSDVSSILNGEIDMFLGQVELYKE